VFEHAPIFVRVWFEWLNWVLILAALQFVATRYHSKVAFAVLWFSYILLLYYFQSLYITRLETPEEHPVSKVKYRTQASWLLAFSGALLSYLLVKALVFAVVSGMGK
jgi:hypothetical protein